MSARHARLIALALCAALPAFASGGGEMPETIPTCAAPQPLAPLQPIGGVTVNYAAGTAIAWSGQEYGTLWTENGQPKFRRLFADGSSNGAIVTIPAGTTYAPSKPGLVWNGTGYGAVWVGFFGGNVQIYFARLNADGTLAAGGGANPVMVSNYGATPTSSAYYPSIAWNGSVYAVVWSDSRNASAPDIYATLVNADGTIANGGASHDLVISTAANTQTMPSVAWSTAGNLFITAWYDDRAGKYEIYRATLAATGAVGGNALTVTGTGNAYFPSLVDTGANLGLAWSDTRDGNYEIYFARLDGRSGVKVGADLRLTNDLGPSQNPVILWTGGEYGVFWGDYRGAIYDIWYQRVSPAGAALGGNVQLTVTTDMGITPQAAYGRLGYLLTANPYAGSNSSSNFAVPIGCAADATPPSCPGGFVAYSITGSTATVGWLPAGDNESDIAYYRVYRNSQVVGKTGNTYFNDSGLGLSTTYAYAIQPVNAAQLQNYGCQTLLYLKTGASLTLTMNKTDPDARLNWTDAGYSNYNIFRGTSPQVMSQIGASAALTAQDPNALLDTVSYFYSVDDPGQ